MALRSADDMQATGGGGAAKRLHASCRRHARTRQRLEYSNTRSSRDMAMGYIDITHGASSRGRGFRRSTNTEEVEDATCTRGTRRYTYAEMATRVDQLAHMLVRELGIQAGDVVGTMAWNTYRHMEAWCVVPSLLHLEGVVVWVALGVRTPARHQALQDLRDTPLPCAVN